jgi:hypothetical protein
VAVSTYQEIHEDKMKGVIQTQFADEIAQLRQLEFVEEFYFREQGHPLSFLVYIPDLILDYFSLFECIRPILRVEGLLRLIGYSPYFVHKDGYAYGVVTYGQIKYATMFDDGTMLQTVNHKRWAQSEPRYDFIRQACLSQTGKGTFANAWQMHVNKVNELAQTRSVVAPLRVSDIIRMEMHADRIIIGMKPDPWNDSITKKNDL